MKKKKIAWKRFRAGKVSALLLATAVAAAPVTGLAAVTAENVLAVTGSEIAEDGTYSSAVTVSKYKNGKLDKTYRGTVYVSVADGKISNINVYASDKQDRFDELLRGVRSSYIGQPATLSGVAAAVDSVSSATAKGSGNTNSEKYYVSNLTDSIQNAIMGAPAASTPDTTGADIPDGIYTGRADMGSNDHYITLNVTVSNGKITDIAVNDADGNWDNLLSQVKSSYIGTNAEAANVDAVTSATTQGYREAIALAIKNALAGNPDPGDTGSNTGDDTGGNSGDSGDDSGNTENNSGNSGGNTDGTGDNTGDSGENSSGTGGDSAGDGYSIVKKLKKAAKGVAAPEAIFTFTMTPKDGASQISNKTISVNSYTDLTSLKADIALTNDDVSKFTAPGIYEYILTEADSGLSSAAKGDMSYNTGNKSYLVRYKIWYNNGVLEPAAVTVHEIINGRVSDEKTEIPEFENCYTVSSQLTVSKSVGGEHADKNKKFEYSVTFTEDEANAGLNLTSTAVLKKNGTEVAAGTQLDYGTQYTFSLSDGETVLFTVPAGTDYELTEAASESYTPSANVVTDGKAETKSAGTGAALTVQSYIGENENKAEFTNTYEDNPLTGLAGGRGPLFILLPVGAGAVVLLALDRKRRAAKK